MLLPPSSVRFSIFFVDKVVDVAKGGIIILRKFAENMKFFLRIVFSQSYFSQFVTLDFM